MIFLTLLDDDEYWLKCWRFINPPTKESDVAGKWFGCIFSGKKSINLFIGKCLNRFLFYDASEGGYVTVLRVSCLQQKFGIGTSDNLLKEHEAGKLDIGNVPVADIVMGPLRAIYKENGKWEFPEYPILKHKFGIIKKENRTKIYDDFIRKSK